MGILRVVLSVAARKKGWQRYKAALDELKTDPSNSDLRQKALYWGRMHAKLVRDKNGNEVLDEVTLMNNINAICASAKPAERNRKGPANGTSTEKRLSDLESLHKKGLISDDEFSQQRKGIIGQI